LILCFFGWHPPTAERPSAATFLEDHDDIAKSRRTRSNRLSVRLGTLRKIRSLMTLRSKDTDLAINQQRPQWQGPCRGASPVFERLEGDLWRFGLVLSSRF
jgi:hypothetical protein